MRTYRFAIYIAPIIFVLMSACYPEGSEGNSDYDLIIGAYDPDYNFKTSTSFILPDTLILLNDSTATELIEISEQQQQDILHAVRDNFTAYAWKDSTGVDSEAETIILVSAVVANYSDNIWSEWKWYENFDNIKLIGIDSHYSWFPSLYDFTRGSLIITMIDAKKLNSNSEEIPLIWVGSISGIVASQTINVSKIVSEIDKLFELSEYPLNKN